MLGMDIVSGSSKETELMIVTENGFGKRSKLKEYKVQGRGGSGVKTGNVTAKTGAIVMARVVDRLALPEGMAGDLLIMSMNGQVIRIELEKGVPVLGRATQGVRLMRFKEDGDKIASVTMV